MVKPRCSGGVETNPAHFVDLIQSLAQLEPHSLNQLMAAAESEAQHNVLNGIQALSHNMDVNFDNGFMANPLGALKNQLDFVGHQMVRVLQSLGQRPCTCDNCECQLKRMRRPSPGPAACKPASDGRAERAPSEECGGPLKPSISGVDLAGFQRGNRRSKYFTEEAKLQVAEYALVHGASAAARRFGIAPSVAAYYQRKMKKHLHLDARLRQLDGRAPDESAEPALAAEGPAHHDRLPAAGLFNAMLGLRQRGRPKLIGDDLDAELVDHMVQLKHQDPHRNLTAAGALHEAKAYVSQRQPGILAENGGPVSLKITWAMKLLGRVNERYRERYGAGTQDELNRTLGTLLADENGLNLFNDQLVKMMTDPEQVVTNDNVSQLMQFMQQTGINLLDPNLSLPDVLTQTADCSDSSAVSETNSAESDPEMENDVKKLASTTTNSEVVASS